jgi:glycosyltransferase 2 family protein
MTTSQAIAMAAPRARRPWPTRWLGRACGLLALLLLAVGAWAGWQGRDALLPALARVEPRLWVLGAVLTLAGLALRTLRWVWVMRALGHRLPALLQTRVFLAGLSLSPTPGKLGETARAALLRPHGVPVAHTLAAFLCDRGSDVIGVALLGAVAGLLAASRMPLLEGLSVLLVGGTLVLAWAWRRSDLAERLLPQRWAGLAEPLTLWARIWRPLPAAGWVALAATAWALQGLLLAVLVAAVHAGPGPAPGLWACVAIYCAATLLGAASLAPSGLGTMDAALVVQLGALGVATPDALAVAVALRVSTLWLAWCVGWLALVSFGRGAKGAK